VADLLGTHGSYGTPKFPIYIVLCILEQEFPVVAVDRGCFYIPKVVCLTPLSVSFFLYFLCIFIVL